MYTITIYFKTLEEKENFKRGNKIKELISEIENKVEGKKVLTNKEFKLIKDKYNAI